MLKAIIFDFDYTLGDSTVGIILSVNYALSKLGYEAKESAEIRQTIGLSLKDTYAALTGNENAAEAEEFRRFFKEKADEVMVDHTTLYPGVEPVLRNLKEKGIQTAIVTTKFHYRIEQILSKFQAMNLFDLIIGGEDVKVEKPNPEGLLRAIEQLGVAKEEVLYVGDSFVDAKTAENAGVAFASVSTGTTKKEEFREYAHVYLGVSILDVYGYIQEQNRSEYEDFTMNEMLGMQRILQDRYKHKWEPIGPETGKNKLLWMLGEVGEVIDIIKKNGGTKAAEDPELRERLVEELADVLMYYNDALLCYGITAGELRQVYKEKFQRNMKRW